MKSKNNAPIRFVVTFILLFVAFYYFNIFFNSITSHGGHYVPFIAEHLNYIEGVRWVLVQSTTALLRLLGYMVICNKDEVLIVGRNMIQVAYSCLGLGVISFFGAFVIAYPKPVKQKLIFLFTGIICIEVLNIIRLTLLALFWNRQKNQIIDHHTLFNIFIYIVIMTTLYFWVKSGTANKNHATN